MSSSTGHIGIVGTGLIGRSWTMLFISRGYIVRLYDNNPQQVESAISGISQQLTALEAEGNLRGTLDVEEQLLLIKPTKDLKSCVQGALYTQECVPEDLSLKMKVFAEIDGLVLGDTIVASSSSAIPSSKFTENLKHRSQYLVAHPVSPPYHMKLVEVVPAPWTSSEVLSRTKQILEDIGQSPVTLKKEIPGFIQPRIQYAVIMAALKLVEDEVMSMEDVDKGMAYGLGTCYSFLGPFETCHLNANGFRDYCKRYSSSIFDISKESWSAVPMSPNSPFMKKLHESLVSQVPLDKLTERRRWRDEGIAKLSKANTELGRKEEK